MPQIRYFVLPLQRRWTIRRDCRRLGAFAEEGQAVATALQLATFDKVRGHSVLVVRQLDDGRWAPCGSREHHALWLSQEVRHDRGAFHA